MFNQYATVNEHLLIQQEKSTGRNGCLEAIGDFHLNETRWALSER